MPSFLHLQEQAGWENEETWVVRDYRPVLERLMAGQEYAFRLTANPVRTVTDEQGRKRRCAHVTADQQRKWLLDRADLLGVEFLTVPVEVHGPDGEVTEGTEPLVEVTSRSVERFKRQGKTVTIARAQIDGTFRTVDPVALRRALTGGVGKARSYGCGMLTLASYRPQSDG